MAYSAARSYQQGATQVPAKRIAGENTYADHQVFEKSNVLKPTSIAAAGSTQADGTVVPLVPFVIVTAADGTKAVTLTPAGAGVQIIIHNKSASDLNIFPPVGGKFNGGSSNAAIDCAGNRQISLVCLDGVEWSAAFTAGS